MAESIDNKVDELIERFFPWGSVHLPTPEERQAHVHRWLEIATVPYRAVATGLLSVIVPILTGLKESLPPSERKRLLYRIDATNITKSPESILEKMAREWDREGDAPPKITFDNLQEMKDLARFRIVANFLSDVEGIRKRLEAPYRQASASIPSAPERSLHEQFLLQHNCFEDLIALDPKSRKTGERCCKGLFTPRPREKAIFKVEVQVVTALQEAWDKKDHFLIYERRRTGQKVSHEHERISYALSEQLYLTDLTFERLKQEGADAPTLHSESHHAHPQRNAQDG